MHPPLPFLPISGWLVAVLFLLMISSIVGKTKFVFAFSEKEYFYDWTATGYSASRTEYWKTAEHGVLQRINPGLPRKKPGRMGFIYIYKFVPRWDTKSAIIPQQPEFHRFLFMQQFIRWHKHVGYRMTMTRENGTTERQCSIHVRCQRIEWGDRGGRNEK